MKKYKLLLLATIGTGLLSGLSFAQDFPVTVTANITAPASQIQLLIDGTQADSVNIDFGKTTVGTAVPQKKVDLSIKTKNMYGQWITMVHFNPSLKNKVISTAQGKATLALVQGYNDTTLNANFIPLAAGDFNGKTSLEINL